MHPAAVFQSMLLHQALDEHWKRGHRAARVLLVPHQVALQRSGADLPVAPRFLHHPFQNGALQNCATPQPGRAPRVIQILHSACPHTPSRATPVAISRAIGGRCCNATRGSATVFVSILAVNSMLLGIVLAAAILAISVLPCCSALLITSWRRCTRGQQQ